MSKEKNIICVGRKSTMNYVLAVLTLFYGSGTDEIVLKASYPSSLIGRGWSQLWRSL